MIHFIKKHRTAIIVLTSSLLISGITMSFQNTPFGPIDKLDTLTDIQDTIPVEKNKVNDDKMSMWDFDQLVQSIDKEMLTIQKDATTIDFDKMHKEINASLENIDFDKMKSEIDKAFKEIDFKKIENGVKTALKEIEWDKMKDDVKASLQYAKKEMEKINMVAIKKQLQEAKMEIEKSKWEINRINTDELMKDAKTGVSKAKQELLLTKEMFKEMEKDGLIDQQEGFTIEYKNKNLFINGKQQSDTIRDKYQHYIKGDTFKIAISKD